MMIFLCVNYFLSIGVLSYILHLPIEFPTIVPLKLVVALMAILQVPLKPLKRRHHLEGRCPCSEQSTR